MKLYKSRGLTCVVALIRGVVSSSINETSTASLNHHYHADGECGGIVDSNSAPGVCLKEEAFAVIDDIDGSMRIDTNNTTATTTTASSDNAAAIDHAASTNFNSNNKGNDSGTSILTTTIPFPKMPKMIRAILHEDWNVLDPSGEEMISTLSKIDGAVEFAHASTTFYEHLKGTFGILSAWGQPEEVKRAGLVHTAYSGDLFQFFLFDANKEEERAELREILGEKGEALAYLFGTVNRGGLCHFKDVVNQVSTEIICPPGNQTVHHRSDVGNWDMEPLDAANILMVTIADYLDQMVDTNGWRDHHQIEDGGKQLYPGNGRPALGFYWFSAVCNGIKDHLEVVPTIFNNCQDVLSLKDEVEARDTYWKVTTEENDLAEEEQINLLNKVVSLNGFVAEPHMMLSQIYYRQGKYLEAAIEARLALEKYYTLASNWDKRRSFGHWVGFGRVLLLRANRMMEKKECTFPCVDPKNPLYVNYNDLNLTSLRRVVKEMNEREE